MRKYYLIIDTETAMDGSIIDIAGVIYTRQSKANGGNPALLEPVNQFAVLLNENWERVELFHDKGNNGAFAVGNLKRRNELYKAMLIDGRRALANVAMVNRWIARAIALYGDNLELTAYNLAFDVDKMTKQGINHELIQNRFCLWQAALGTVCKEKAFKQHILENHHFTNRTKKTGHIGVKTNAEVVSAYITGLDIIEPHQALEDITGHELPILERVLNVRKWREKIKPYTWKHYALRNFYKIK